MKRKRGADTDGMENVQMADLSHSGRCAGAPDAVSRILDAVQLVQGESDDIRHGKFSVPYRMDLAKLRDRLEGHKWIQLRHVHFEFTYDCLDCNNRSGAFLLVNRIWLRSYEIQGAQLLVCPDDDDAYAARGCGAGTAIHYFYQARLGQYDFATGRAIVFRDAVLHLPDGPVYTNDTDRAG